jgi:hypothetical protein
MTYKINIDISALPQNIDYKNHFETAHEKGSLIGIEIVDQYQNPDLTVRLVINDEVEKATEPRLEDRVAEVDVFSRKIHDPNYFFVRGVITPARFDGYINFDKKDDCSINISTDKKY